MTSPEETKQAADLILLFFGILSTLLSLWALGMVFMLRRRARESTPRQTLSGIKPFSEQSFKGSTCDSSTIGTITPSLSFEYKKYSTTMRGESDTSNEESNPLKQIVRH